MAGELACARHAMCDMAVIQPELLTYASHATQWWGYNTKSQELHVSIYWWIKGKLEEGHNDVK